MDRLVIKYSTAGKALPPRPIRVEVPGWGGSPDRKKVDGSEPEPWHCPPFVEASTYGLELLYQYETECHVINDGGRIRFEWDTAREPGGVAGDGEFGLFAPLPARFYFFGTSVDVQAPPGYVLRTQPHPRFFTDQTGAVPLALMGHVQTEWWPKKLFVVFKVPPPGGRHIFRKGEPYVQLVMVPHRVAYEPQRMTDDEEKRRRELEHTILVTARQIATNGWQNPDGEEFNDHYKMLAGAFARDGMAGVDETIRQAKKRQAQSLPPGKSMAECLDLAYQLQGQRKFYEARDIYFAVLRREPANAEAVSRLGILAVSMGMPRFAVKLMKQAAALRPDVLAYHNNLAEAQLAVGQLPEAEASFRTALRMAPNDAEIVCKLAQVVARLGRKEEAIAALRAAVTAGLNAAMVHATLGALLGEAGRQEEARAAYQAALTRDPRFAPAVQGLQRLVPSPGTHGDG